MAVELKSAIKAAKFKTDWVTVLAILILISIIACELGLVIGLPIYLKNSVRWEKEVAYQELLNQLDVLRGGMRGCKNGKKGDEGEVALVQSCLNHFAFYLRHEDKDLSREDIRKIRNVLDRFETVYIEITKNKTFNSSKQLDLTGYLADLQEKCRKAESSTF